ncbi:hypothetical protein GN244_ATG12831 [Phytophthora infestans]|uniref:M96 mating-specific protein family n=1 Tax=Phytophthora infestans TaxID=4787 RepID=A0A833SLR5_PHYIN|nr:hypothetical protein GN244_ATG12831 [Phytophthora infestans]KAF4134771.1 hypothetical protein GN958_ATG16027 [Phytophthora infestans]
MASHLEFLHELTEFLDTDPLLQGLSSRKSLQDEPSDLALHWGAIVPTSLSPTMNGDESESSNSEPSTHRSRRGRETTESRREYRARRKTEREKLRQLERDLSKKVVEIVEGRRGARTTARMDLALTKSFWRHLALHQKCHRLDVEAENKRLSAILKSQAMYIENLREALSKSPSWASSGVSVATSRCGGKDMIDDHKWLRLKSSDEALFKTYIQDVKDSYVRVDEVFEDCGMDSLPLSTTSSLHRHNPDGRVSYIQFVNKVLQPSCFEDTCKSMWGIRKMPYRRTDRETLCDMGNEDNTAAVKFRLKRSPCDGSTVSILQRVVCRQFIDVDCVVIVWKAFWEGEDSFSGLDIDETGWMRLRPHCTNSKGDTVLEGCSRLVPVPDTGPLPIGVWSNALIHAANDVNEWQTRFADDDGQEND